MAKEKYFGGKIEESCSYCFYGAISKTGQSVMCEKVGVVPLDNKPCKKWLYDPFKRIPAAQLEKQEKYAEAIKKNEAMRQAKAKKYGYELEEMF